MHRYNKLLNKSIKSFQSAAAQALYESTFLLSVTDNNQYQYWGADYSYLVFLSFPWVQRGGNYYFMFIVREQIAYCEYRNKNLAREYQST
jgi:hypothetical protein